MKSSFSLTVFREETTEYPEGKRGLNRESGESCESVWVWWLRIVLAALAMTAAATAQEPKVRVSFPDKDGVWAGEREVLAVELLAPGYFSGAAAFDLPQVPGVLILPPAGSPTVSGETGADGVAYTVQRHELSVLTRRGGDVEIPAFPVRFHFKRQPLDKDVVEAEVKTEPVKFTVKVPPGAEGMGGIISARGLEVTEEWKPEPGKGTVKAGDAFTRTITFSAPDVPAMAFPVFPVGKIDGIGIYQRDPEVLDKDDRGSLTGMRRDTVTYVCQRSGEFTIPAVRVTWFDLDGEKLKTLDFPERKLVVAVNPAMASHAAAGAVEKPPVPWGMVAGWLLAAWVAGYAMWRWREKLVDSARRMAQPWKAVPLQQLNPGGVEK